MYSIASTAQVVGVLASALARRIEHRLQQLSLVNYETNGVLASPYSSFNISGNQSCISGERQSQHG